MWWIKQLSSPLSYLRIKQGNNFFCSKKLYDFGLPFFLGCGTAFLHFWLPVSPRMLGENGIVDIISGLLQLLVAFFIAALAAVATFDRESMDKEMRGHPAVLRRKKTEVILTRRQFVCHLFGYLAFVSLMLLLSIVLVKIVYPTLQNYLELGNVLHFKTIAMFVFWVVFWNIIITTILGLHFLSNRMQYDD